MKQEEFIQLLSKYCNPYDAKLIYDKCQKHGVFLKLTAGRTTKWGYYKSPLYKGEQHIISLNADLNPYAFVLTFYHELAHLEVFLIYGNKVKPHGVEWKNMFKKYIIYLANLEETPLELKKAYINHSINIKAAANADINLRKALYKFDKVNKNEWFMEDIKPEQKFKMPNGMIMKMIEKRRTRYLCQEESSKRKYLVHATTPVTPI